MRRAGTWAMVLGIAMAAVACGGSVDVTASSGAGGSASTSGTTGSGAGTTGSGAGSSTGTTGAGGAPNACGPDAKSCTQPSDCVFAPASCCVCGEPELSDYLAVNTAHAAACACDGPVCDCASSENPNLGLTCQSGQCAGFDVRKEDKLSACTTDAECRLRAGLSCCEGCDGQSWDLVAVRADAEAAIESLVCSPGQACPACAPQYPPDTLAQCISGHCAVVFVN